MPEPATDSPAAAEVEALVADVERHRALYYAGEPELSDAEYDALEDRLRALLRAHPELTPADNPLERVGSTAIGTFGAPVRHKHPMLSLAKATSDEELDAFFATTLKAERGRILDFGEQEYLAAYKFDGVSLSATYEDGRLVLAATRGRDGIGDDVTEAVQDVAGLPLVLDEPISCEVRGELVMRLSEFAAYNQRNPEAPLSNARNAVSGTLKRKDRSKHRPLTFMPFDVLDHPDASDTIATLEALGFVPEGMHRCPDAEAVRRVIAEAEQARPDLDFLIDGVVIRLADRDAYVTAGARSASPRGAIAWKWSGEVGTSTLVEVDHTPGKGGKCVPRGRLDPPVHVGGVTVTFATLANHRVIRERGLMLNQRVSVKRAGDVIPYIAGPAGEPTGEEVEIVAPTHCPSCGEPLTVEGKSEELYCTNAATCPAQRVRRLEHWASRSAADIDAVGPTWIAAFTEAGLLTRRADFYALTREQLLEFPRLGEKSADVMLASIANAKAVGMRRALIGFAIPHVGEGTAKRLARAGFTSVEQVADASEDELVAVEDIGPTVARSLLEHLHSEVLREDVEALRAAGVDLDVAPEDVPVERPVGEPTDELPLLGWTAVVSGAVHHPDSGEKVVRGDFETLLERAGASTASSVSAKTTHLVAGGKLGAAKAQKAEQLGVQVVGQDEVWPLLRAAGLL